MVERILPKLTEKLGDTNLSERTIKEYATAIAPTIKEESQLTDDFIGLHTGILKTMGGQLAHDAKSGIEQFKKDYKPIPPTQPTPNQQPPTEQINPNDEISKKLQEIEDWKKSLEQRYESEAKAAQRDSLIADAKKKASGQGAVDETIMSFILPLVNPNDNDTVDTLSATIKSKYDEAYSKLKGGGYTPASGSGSPNHKANTAALNAFKEQMIKEGKLPSKNTN